jgi:hypothetical protein
MNNHRPDRKDPAATRDVRDLTEEEARRLETDPEFHDAMEEADRDEREGRWVSHEEMIRRMRELASRR